MIIQPESFSAYHAIVLDFDGVMVDSNPVKSGTFYEIWPNASSNVQSIVDCVLSGPGDRYSYIREIYRQLQVHEKLNHNPEYYINQYTQSVKFKILKSGLKPDVPAFFDRYQDKCLLINSMTPEKPLKEVVEQLNICPPIREARGLPMTKIQIFHYFMKKYHFKKHEMVFVGDSESDFKFAEKMQIDFYGIISNGGSLQSIKGSHTLPA